MGGGGEKEACHNEVKLLPMQELEAARTLLSTMNASHFHTPPAGSQLCGTFGFKCTTTVISATSETEHPSFFFFCFPSSHLPKSKLHWVSAYTRGHRARDQKCIPDKIICSSGAHGRGGEAEMLKSKQKSLSQQLSRLRGECK